MLEVTQQQHGERARANGHAHGHGAGLSEGWYSKTSSSGAASGSGSGSGSGANRLWTPPSTPPLSTSTASGSSYLEASVSPGQVYRSSVAPRASSSSLSPSNPASDAAGAGTSAASGSASRTPAIRRSNESTHASSQSSSSSNNKPLPKSPRTSASYAPNHLLAASGSSSVSNGSAGHHPPSAADSQNHLRTSTNSGASIATSNSSLHQPPAPFSTSNNSAAALNEVDHTAALIKRLYDRLERHGVPGDGWDEGKERSRDGIISNEMNDDQLSPAKPTRLAPTDNRRESAMILASKEDQILKRVDRYGFFSSSHPAALACQHNRLATLRSEPYSLLAGSNKKAAKAPVKAPASPLLATARLSHRGSTASLQPALTPVDMALETKRIDKWSDMLVVARKDRGGNAQEWTLAGGWWDGRGTASGGGKYRKFQRRVFKGVPDRWRRAVWGLMMEKMAEEVSGREHVQSLEALQDEYRAFLLIPSAEDVQIDLDVPRTISGHVLFHTRYGQGQRALFHVLHAFGLHCDDIGGYCQGMGPIAATLLCYFEPERAYACLVRLFYQYGLRHIFEPGFPGLLEAFYVQERLVELLMPDVHQAFVAHGISTSSYATKWYITLFSNSVPFPTQLRLWDGLLLEGVDFLVITSLSIIWCFREDFTNPDASFESILSSLSSYFLVSSDDAILRWIRKALRRADLRLKIKDWREEWQGFVKDGSAPRRVT
ncbi:hypothetical protein RQP46_003376 [Phenoliferia psychrophenolica]